MEFHGTGGPATYYRRIGPLMPSEAQMLSALRAAAARNGAVYVGYVVDGEGDAVQPYRATVSDACNDVYVDLASGRSLAFVELVFDGDDPEDDGWQVLWLDQMRHSDEPLLQQAQWRVDRARQG